MSTPASRSSTPPKLAIGAGIFLHRTITLSVRRMTDVMLKLADGDLAVTVPDSDRGDEICQMAGVIQEFVTQIDAIVAAVAASANEMRANAGSLAGTAEILRGRVDGFVSAMKAA
jgi:methyl-accepting chemotaxis protein